MQFSRIIMHTAGTVQSWFEEGELGHLPWSAQAPHLNIIEPLWPVLESRGRNRFPLPTFLKQLQDVLQEEWCKAPLDICQNFNESIPRRTAAVVQYHVKMCLQCM
jgi:hypothetical protein